MPTRNPPKTLSDLEELLEGDLKVKVAGERVPILWSKLHVLTSVGPRCRWYEDSPFRSLPTPLYSIGILLVDGVLRGKYMVRTFAAVQFVA